MCTRYLAERRWPDGPVCPACSGKQHSHLSTRFLWKYKACKKHHAGSFNKACGQVEVDETFIGQKARNMHKAVRSRKITGTGGKDKTMVVGVMKRGGTVSATVAESRLKKALQSLVKEHVDPGAELFTRALKSYEGLSDEYVHQIVNHAVGYVKGHVHTNGMENFWSHLKRTLYGTYISVMPFHSFRYPDEQTFRFNNRNIDDAMRFRLSLRTVSGRRLTYKEVTGKMRPYKCR